MIDSRAENCFLVISREIGQERSYFSILCAAAADDDSSEDSDT